MGSYQETSSHATCQSGNTRPQSSQLAEPLWTDPGVKSGNHKRNTTTTGKVFVKTEIDEKCYCLFDSFQSFRASCFPFTDANLTVIKVRLRCMVLVTILSKGARDRGIAESGKLFERLKKLDN